MSQTNPSATPGEYARASLILIVRDLGAVTASVGQAAAYMNWPTMPTGPTTPAAVMEIDKAELGLKAVLKGLQEARQALVHAAVNREGVANR